MNNDGVHVSGWKRLESPGECRNLWENWVGLGMVEENRPCSANYGMSLTLMPSVFAIAAFVAGKGLVLPFM